MRYERCLFGTVWNANNGCTFQYGGHKYRHPLLLRICALSVLVSHRIRNNEKASRCTRPLQYSRHADIHGCAFGDQGHRSGYPVRSAQQSVLYIHERCAQAFPQIFQEPVCARIRRRRDARPAQHNTQHHRLQRNRYEHHRPGAQRRGKTNGFPSQGAVHRHNNRLWIPRR